MHGAPAVPRLPRVGVGFLNSHRYALYWGGRTGYSYVHDVTTDPTTSFSLLPLARRAGEGRSWSVLAGGEMRLATIDS